ncbi:hypothetical protein [Vulcanisaeta distributa]|uniref:hypothetical protein n=1 Tax=Vulcanisaeta distributa TaxID=164451 RepID=UPI0006D1C05D|nr:hypothetical protein [Vulcanisaeta distributa]
MPNHVNKGFNTAVLHGSVSPTDLMLILTVPMVIIHAAFALISLRYLTVPRPIGLPIAIYESTYYVILLNYALLSHYSMVLLGIITLFLVIHVGGAYLYVNGALSYLSRNRNNLKYYGYYELSELVFLIIIMTSVFAH